MSNSREYRNRWYKLLEIINEIQEENIELNNQHIEYNLFDYHLLYFLIEIFC